VASDLTTAAATEGAAHRTARRNANLRKARAASPATDAQGLVAFGCECMRDDCERSVSVPLYVYRRLLDAGNQYLVQAGHHAFQRNRTIVVSGLMRIEERVGDEPDGTELS
jgi:hypothetical protein